MNRINLITLGVRDINKSLIFYRDGLEFQTSVNEVSPAIVFFYNAGTKLALYPLDELAKDINEKEPPEGIVKKAMFSQDVYQLGGTWLIETSGEILWQHIDSEPSDHATIPTILSVLDEFVR